MPARYVGEYQIGKRLGKGGQGKVFVARHNAAPPLSDPVALKVIDASKLNAKAAEMLNAEIDIMKRLNHPNVNKFIEIFPRERYIKKNGRELAAVVIISELARGGELFNYLMKGGFPIEIARLYGAQLMNVINYCHEKGIGHRDLKPENILLDNESTFNLKVIDFGMAKLTTHDGEVTHTFAGTITYMPPEAFDNTIRGTMGYDPLKMDIWSCGVLLFIFCFGVPPIAKPDRSCWFLNKLREKKFDNFWNAHKKFTPNEHLNDMALRDLIQGMLAVNPAERISATEVMNHQWFTHGAYADQRTLVAEMKRRKAEIDREAHDEAVKKARERGMAVPPGGYNPFSLDVHRAVEGKEDDCEPALPLPEDFIKEGRVHDFQSNQTSPQLIGKHIVAAVEAMDEESKIEGAVVAGAVVAEKEHYKYKVKIESVGGCSVVMNCQIFFDRSSDVHYIAVDRREGTLADFHKSRQMFFSHLGDIIAEPL